MSYKSSGDVESAFVLGLSKRICNAQTDGRILLLFGNRIAEWRSDGLYITNCGYKTSTTKNHLNWLPNVSISQANFVWYLNGHAWDGEWIKVSDGPPPEVQAGKRSKKPVFDTTERWVSSNAWRGYSEPMYAVCGANDTGSYSDSPCPSHVRVKELDDAAKALGDIPYKTHACQTSNVFSTGVYLIVPPDRIVEAREKFAAYFETARHTTSLLYSVTGEVPEEKESNHKTVAALAMIGELLEHGLAAQNDFKKRIFEAGLGNAGLSFPEDWHTLTEEEKKRRLDGVLNILNENKN